MRVQRKLYQVCVRLYSRGAGEAQGDRVADSRPCTSSRAGKAQPPDPPLHLSLLEATAQSLRFGWATPLTDGGSSIIHYELCYHAMVQKEVRGDARRDAGGLESRRFVVTTETWSEEGGEGKEGEAPRGMVPLEITVDGLSGNQKISKVGHAMSLNVTATSLIADLQDGLHLIIPSLLGHAICHYQTMCHVGLLPAPLPQCRRVPPPRRWRATGMRAATRRPRQ